MYSASRALQLLGLVVTGFGFFVGVFGGNVRAELVLLGSGGHLFWRPPHSPGGPVRPRVSPRAARSLLATLEPTSRSGPG